MTTTSPALNRFSIGGEQLTMAEYVFVIEYLKDQNQRRAAKVAGKYKIEDQEALFAGERVQRALQSALVKRMEVAQVDGAWLLQQFVENHYIARQQDKLNASNQALLSIGKLATVDAFAAEKVQVTNATDVVERLQRARARAKKPDEVSFLN